MSHPKKAEEYTPDLPADNMVESLDESLENLDKIRSHLVRLYCSTERIRDTKRTISPFHAFSECLRNIETYDDSTEWWKMVNTDYRANTEAEATPSVREIIFEVSQWCNEWTQAKARLKATTLTPTRRSGHLGISPIDDDSSDGVLDEKLTRVSLSPISETSSDDGSDFSETRTKACAHKLEDTKVHNGAKRGKGKASGYDHSIEESVGFGAISTRNPLIARVIESTQKPRDPDKTSHNPKKSKESRGRGEPKSKSNLM